MKATKEIAIKHNLRRALKKAVIDNDMDGVRKAAQAIFEAGYELEDMDFLPGMFSVMASAIIASGWVPDIRELMT